MQKRKEKHAIGIIKDDKKIPAIVPQNNYVLCKRLHDNLNDLTNGLQRASEAFNENQFLSQNVERIFEVVKNPSELTEEPGYWKTEIETKIGDHVIVSYLDSLNSPLIIIKGVEHRLIKYYDIIAIINDNEPRPINGNILFRPIFIKHDSSVIITDHIRTIDPRKGEIFYTSKPNEYYTKKFRIDYDKGINLKKGDVVLFTKPWNKFAPSLEDDLHRKLDKTYFYCQRYRIGGRVLN